jgi:AcrR family transcriptional regulator
VAAEPRPKLSRERVVRAAIELADSEGIEALSMRRLGQALGIEAMTLYYHVGRKESLLGAMVESVVSEWALADAPHGNWRLALSRSATSAHEALLRHPWSCSLMVSHAEPSPVRLRWMDSVLGCLRAAGFSVAMTHYAYHALDSHIVGFTLWELGFPFRTREELLAMADEFMQQVDLAHLPHLAEHVGYHMDPASAGGQSAFDFGLELILDGIERLRDDESAASEA